MKGHPYCISCGQLVAIARWPPHLFPRSNGTACTLSMKIGLTMQEPPRRANTNYAHHAHSPRHHTPSPRKPHPHLFSKNHLWSLVLCHHSLSSRPEILTSSSRIQFSAYIDLQISRAGHVLVWLLEQDSTFPVLPSHRRIHLSTSYLKSSSPTGHRATFRHPAIDSKSCPPFRPVIIRHVFGSFSSENHTSSPLVCIVFSPALIIWSRTPPGGSVHPRSGNTAISAPNLVIPPHLPRRTGPSPPLKPLLHPLLPTPRVIAVACSLCHHNHTSPECASPAPWISTVTSGTTEPPFATGLLPGSSTTAATTRVFLTRATRPHILQSTTNPSRQASTCFSPKNHSHLPPTPQMAHHAQRVVLDDCFTENFTSTHPLPFQSRWPPTAHHTRPSTE